MDVIFNVFARLVSLLVISVCCVGVMALAEWLVGRLMYAFGACKPGLRLMAMSGLFTSRLPHLCSKGGCYCDGGCGLWTCPYFGRRTVTDHYSY